MWKNDTLCNFTSLSSYMCFSTLQLFIDLPSYLRLFPNIVRRVISTSVFIRITTQRVSQKVLNMVPVF